MATPLAYRVTATALNLRAAPNTAAPRLATIANGTLVTRLEDLALAPEWFKISWGGQVGFSVSAYLQPMEGALSLPSAPTDVEIPPAPGVEERDRDLSKLHPTVRDAVTKTLETLNANGIPFRVFEGFRAPERQEWLFSQGRTRPGGIVTRAQPWQSMHQYGLAADLVLFTGTGWSWDASGEKAAWWETMHTEAGKHGLSPLSFERPHIELAGSDWQVLQRGQVPDGGDESWYESLAFSAERWRRSGRAPFAPPLAIGERPQMPE